jgi:membrane protein implicated in regulation of membrane protease activity
MLRRLAERPPVLAKYLLFQLPGMALAGIALVVLVRVWDLSPGAALLLFAFWVAKDFAMYPLLRNAYAGGRHDAGEALVGAIGTTRERLDPAGYVRVGAELWRAEVSPDRAPVESGAAVRVCSVRNLTLQVEPVRDTLDDSARGGPQISRTPAPPAGSPRH